MRLLVDKGADVLSTSNRGETPGDKATEGSHPKIAAMLKTEAARRALFTDCELSIKVGFVRLALAGGDSLG